MEITLENWKEYLSECGDLHSPGCCANDEFGCDTDVGVLECCDNMRFFDEFVTKIIEERDKYWVLHLKEHTKFCVDRKSLTKVKNKIWGKFQFPK